MVLLHGQAFTSKTWEELGTMAILAVNGYQALAMDLPGRGTLIIPDDIVISCHCNLYSFFYPGN